MPLLERISHMETSRRGLWDPMVYKGVEIFSRHVVDTKDVWRFAFSNRHLLAVNLSFDCGGGGWKCLRGICDVKKDVEREREENSRW